MLKTITLANFVLFSAYFEKLNNNLIYIYNSNNKLYFIMIWLMSCFKYDGFILNIVIISNMDTQYNYILLPESNNVM